MLDSASFGQWEIRPAFLTDVEAVRDLHQASVRRLCAPDYSPAQLETWLRRYDLAAYERLIQGLLMVADLAGALVGMAQLDLAEGRIRFLHVHPDYARRKVGTDLLRELHSQAYAEKLPRMTVLAPLNAVNFFRSRDFMEVGPAMLPLPEGAGLPCLEMAKPVYRVLELPAGESLRAKLLRTLACDDRMCMLATLRQLRELAPLDMLEEIVLLLRHADSKTRRRAAVALGTFSKLKTGEVTVEQKAAELAACLVDGSDEQVRYSCAIHLMPVHLELVDQAFLRALQDPHERIVQIACTEVAHRCGAPGVAAIYGLLEHSLARIRLLACETLVRGGKADGRVVAVLEAMHNGPEAAAFDAEMASTRELRTDFAKLLVPLPTEDVAWETFDGLLANARTVAADNAR